MMLLSRASFGVRVSRPSTAPARSLVVCGAADAAKTKKARRPSTNRKDLVDYIADKGGITKKSAAEVLGFVLEAVEEALVKGERVTLVGFGSFEVRERSARNGINPQTKAKIQIPASKRAVFSAAKALKDKVNGKFVAKPAAPKKEAPPKPVKVAKAPPPPKPAATAAAKKQVTTKPATSAAAKKAPPPRK